jgi:hypothetical protein
MPCGKGTWRAINAARRCDEEQKGYDWFDAYWTQIVKRVYEDHEALCGKEELFYRWSCIFGETMVDGIEAYFERRFDQFDADMSALRVAGFPHVAYKYQYGLRENLCSEGPEPSDGPERPVAEVSENG